MRPRLLMLQLQEEEREAEYRLPSTSTYITPLTNHKPGTPDAARTGNHPRLRRGQSLHSIGDTDSELADPLLIKPTPNVDSQGPKESNALATPKSATTDSLFGDSPVDGTEGSHLTEAVSIHQKEGLAQPTSNKRKLDDANVAAEPQQAVKRLRCLSLP
ncbi:hypothetical protein KVR01_001480 [Diaporthe batatas]|uniref:uncharacterized protein n=1 Tax=Diaporthe batatas TaxID=748121 RepID=UPI001D037A9F|nr:uncharacterized protein KVR01_001480 [Diaporthe batatas]KAG8168731.1 hypothetical protein KVR01_001480 [Diaporthe batatas]